MKNVSNIADKFEASIKKEASELNITKVIIALSGGADSIATAFALRKCGLEVIALNCNFHLRGSESDRDSEFVKKFCETFHLPLIATDFDTKGYLESNPGLSVEMACRNLRHEWFKEQLEATGFERIATGHNADDNIETLFLNMLRGSGTRGLKGMAKDNGTIWRPLLQFHRSEILEYLRFYGLEYVVDSSNLESDYRRNFLRNEILPLFRKEWPGFNQAMDKTLRNIENENKIVEEILKEKLPKEGNSLSIDIIKNFPAPNLLIKRFLDKYGPYKGTEDEVLTAINANKPHIRKWRLKYGELMLRNGILTIRRLES